MNPDAARDLSHITNAWKRFISTGRSGSGGVRPEIAASWERCYHAGVDPVAISGGQLLEPDAVDGLLARQKDFIEIARPFMVKLNEFVSGSGFIVLLSDERGYIMEVIGDRDTRANAVEINLITGSSWDERYVGTNGVGTALILGEPFQVTGPEHYCQSLHHWTCSAAPVLRDDGRVRGVLQLSGPSHAAHLHTLGMVVAAVQAIADQIRIRQQNRELSVLNDSLSNMFQTMSDGALIVDRHGRVTQVNPRAEEVLGRRLIGDSIETVLGRLPQAGLILKDGRAYTDIEMMVNTPAGRIHCLGSGKPIRDQNGLVSGAVLFFNPINRVKKLINRFSGAQASFSFEDIIGGHEGLRQAIRVAYLAATSESNVIVEGESGTGKELFAQAIHNQGARREGPFVALNCAALPRDLIASELFGYSEGAFTGARRGGRPGKFEMASGGTLFLDEIGDMPLDQQASLLRVLQEKKITRIGSARVLPVDVRIICATNRKLKDEVERGNFRRDLYYRLNVIQVCVPPLRDRGDDVLVLFDCFMGKLCHKLNLSRREVAPEVRQRLLRYDWPGNVRELENVVERIIHMSDGSRIELQHLPAELNQPSAVRDVRGPEMAAPGSVAAEKSIKDQLAAQERRLIVELLERYQGNISQAARAMGVSRNTLYRKMQLYGIARQYSFG